MRVRVLGSAAGGGLPQWNCGCDNCGAARRGDPAVRPRTQESLALSGDGGDTWFVINASPEIRSQIESFPGLWPRAPRHSPIAGLLLTNGDLDHCLGLLSLRESHPLVVHATSAVRAGFTDDNVLYRTMERFAGQVTWRALVPGEEQPLGGAGSDLSVTAIALPGKLPLHLEGRRAPSPEDNVGLLVRDRRTGGLLAYCSGTAGPSPALEEAAAAADVLFLDGTFWSSDELIAAGLGTRTAAEMAHWPVGGDGGRGDEGSLAFLARLARPAGAASAAGGGRRQRRILTHVNNTNPLVREDGPQRRALAAAGIEVAHDGLELEV